jgi:hypothetical protein
MPFALVDVFGWEQARYKSDGKLCLSPHDLRSRPSLFCKQCVHSSYDSWRTLVLKLLSLKFSLGNGLPTWFTVDASSFILKSQDATPGPTAPYTHPVFHSLRAAQEGILARTAF